LGIREDLRRAFPGLLPLSPVVTVMSVLQGLPPLRSGLSNGQDAAESWLAFLHTALARRWLRGATRVAGPAVRDLITETIRNLVPPAEDRGGEYIPAEITCSYAPEWFLDRRLGGVCNHATRTHMPRDLHRYLYAACFAQIHGKSPRLWDFPKDLLPKHVNVPKALQGGYFADRFRVQLSNHPATTVTSHIAKDGHYYIHPDPTQCRALTVREAARLQTFPDNYFFCGGRTEQYRQVGNAVPPLLARQIARIVWNVLR
jgi:DNA (cytosine-5)-methyltransferase 1